MSNPIIFNRELLRLHKERAARLQGVDFLLKELVSRATERVEEINRHFPVVLDLGAHHGMLQQELEGKFGIQAIIQSDFSESMIKKAPGLRLVADEEFLPFADNRFDLCLSLGSLHWVNDLPGTLIQIFRTLKPGGLFIAMLPGGTTLKELRQSFEKVEIEEKGGISPRISPFLDSRDAGSLLSRAGFTHPVIDVDTIIMEYEHPLKLLKELRAMGETNALIHSQKTFTPCSLIMQVVDRYMQDFTNENNRIVASLEFVTMTAWKP